MDAQALVLTYVSVVSSLVGLLLTYVIFNVNRREKQVKEERKLFSDAIANVHRSSEKSLSEHEARAEERVRSIQEECKSIEKRVRCLEYQQVTKEEVKSLLSDRVRPIEDSLKLLEREVREVTRDINKELKETATEITREVWTGLNQLTEIMRQLSNDLSSIKGQLKAEGRREND